MDFFYKEKKREREIIRMYLDGERPRGREVKGSRGREVLRSRGQEVERSRWVTTPDL